MGQLTYVKFRSKYFKLLETVQFHFSCCYLTITYPVYKLRSVSEPSVIYFATGQPAALHMNFAPSADKIDASDWLDESLTHSWGVLTCLLQSGAPCKASNWAI